MHGLKPCTRLLAAASCLVALFAGAPGLARAQGDYQLFEADPVRALALAPDGTRLLAVNTPDDQLEILDIDGSGLLSRAASVSVGMRPVAVAARTNDEVWVVNHLSDSVSIVKLTPQPHVVSTLLVGDEPRDLVFAGPGGRWAFVTTAHRGQHSPNGGRVNRSSPNAGDESQFDTPGVGRADVWVFDTTALGSELGGAPASVLTLFGDRPRALAVSPDGSTVYAAIFRSGNRTTVMNEGLVCNTSSTRMNNNTVQPACNVNGVSIPGGYPPPHKNAASQNRPETGLILRFNRPGGPAGTWSDELGRNWNAVVKFNLPDRDVFAIDATANPPSVLDASSSCAGTDCWAGVGTVLFNMAVNPVSGKVYVSNSEAQNQVRFEGNGVRASGPSGKLAGSGEPPTVQGNLAQARITVLDGASVLPRHLNKHIDYSLRPAPAGVKEKSLAIPVDMVVTPDGATLYVAAFGSGKIGKFSTAALESNSFVPNAADQIALSGGGPTGLVLAGNRLYTLSRFDMSLKVVDTGLQAEIQSLALHNPEPAEIVAGRPLLYDAPLTSSNGEASCASCHISGDMDDLAWDLGDPDASVVANSNPFNPIVPSAGDPLPKVFHPMKGPMGTQSLRGLDNMGPQHWRGDRQGSEVQGFEAFLVAFQGLLGANPGQVTAAQMTQFRKFALELRYPPNPIRKLDNSPRPDENAGELLYNGRITDTIANCNQCHTLSAAAGHFGGDGRSVFDGGTQHIKVPHLRNQYQKLGMFGMSQPLSGVVTFTGDFTHQGDQIRGFGFIHDGSVDSLARFFGLSGFDMSASEEDHMEAFTVAFPSDLAPIVGQQLTLTASNASVAGPQLDLLIARAEAAFSSEVLGGVVKECDLIAKLLEGGREHGYLYDPASGLFLPDDGGAGISDGTLRAKAASIDQEVTYTCQPPGSGHRVARDRDRDTLWNGVETNTGVFVSASNTGSNPALADTDSDGFDDGVEVLLGFDPNDPLSNPNAPPPVPSLGPLGLAAIAGLMALCAGARLRPVRRRAQPR